MLVFVTQQLQFDSVPETSADVLWGFITAGCVHLVCINKISLNSTTLINYQSFSILFWRGLSTDEEEYKAAQSLH